MLWQVRMGTGDLEQKETEKGLTEEVSQTLFMYWEEGVPLWNEFQSLFLMPSL